MSLAAIAGSYNGTGWQVVMGSGDQVVRWDSSGLPAGIYYYRLTTKD